MGSKKRDKIRRIVCLVLAVMMIMGVVASALSMVVQAAFTPTLSNSGHKMVGAETGENITVTEMGQLPGNVFTTAGEYTFTVSGIGTIFVLTDENGDVVSGATISTDKSTIQFHNLKVVKKKDSVNEAWKDTQGVTVNISAYSASNLGSTPVVSKQKITVVGKDTSEMSTFRRGNRGDIRFTVTDTNVNIADYRGDATVMLTGGAFKSDSKSTTTITQVATPEGMLAFEVVLGSMVYTGIGKSIDYRLVYEAKYDKVSYNGSITFNEYRFQEYKEPSDNDSSSEEEEEKPLDPLVPHIIVDSYEYGGRNVTAGDTLTLNMIIKNTSEEFDLENIVMKITPPDAFSVASSSNSFYIEELRKGRTMERSIELAVKPDAKPESHNIAISFDFQYVANELRKSSKSEENIAIPVTQIDRFSISNVDAPGILYVGDEYPMSAYMINKGKSPVYNVVVDLILNNGENKQSQFIGNVESGKEATADFFLSGKEGGELKGEVVVQYEDSNMNIKTLSHPIQVVVQGNDFFPGDEGNIGGFEPIDPIEPVVAEPDYTVRNVLIFCGGVIALITCYTTIMKIKAKRGDFADDDI